MSTPDSNYVYEPGTIFVAPGGGSAPVPLPPGAENQALFSTPSTYPGVGWGAGSAMGNVVGPVSSTAHNLASFADTSGVLLEDSGIAKGTVAIGPGTSTANHIAAFDDTDGVTLIDSGLLYTSVATGPSSAVSANFPAFNGTGGKTLEDSGFSNNSFLQVIRGTAIDMTATGDTTLFTPATAFVVTQIILYAITITGTETYPILNIGTNSTAYNNLLSAYTTQNAATHAYTEIFAPFQNSFTVIPASTALKVNVTTADTTASVNSQRFDIVGYYV